MKSMHWESESLLEGMFVQLPGHQALGKLKKLEEDFCIISVFYSRNRIETVTCAVSEIKRAYLSPQTRAYILGDDGIQVGRVSDYIPHESGLVTYELRFPNGGQQDFSETVLYTRPWKAPEDPAEILAVGGAESQYLHDRRQATLLPIRSLTSAAQGLTALISAGVDFVPHQVAAVRRILSDPVQRYLLADEVGLGKTIEAGLVIRQHLIDKPDTRVLVVAPSVLCDQWRYELTKKLRLDQFENTFEYIAHADLIHVRQPPDILVIDEAHHLVGQEADTCAHLSAQLRELAAVSPVLLLLSATPPLGEEEKFLALLNLLDPRAHPLDDLPGFRMKLEQRRALGRLLLSLDPETSGLVLRHRSAELAQKFPDDSVVQELAPQLIAATREAPEKLPDLCRMLKGHVADCYRIHQRLIRSRRIDAQGWEFQARGPDNGAMSHILTECDPSEDFTLLLNTLEDWRSAAIDSLVNYDVLPAPLVTRYRELLGAVLEGGSALRAWLTHIRPIFPDEQEILDVLSAQAEVYDDTTRIEVMVESTKRLIRTLHKDVRHPKIVVFATEPVMAEAFYNALQNEDEAPFCFLLAKKGETNTSEDVVTQFAHVKADALLIVDLAGEEGLNLSFADAIVHLDLPLSAARIEQRIGRLDRYGRQKGIIRHRIFLPLDEYETSFGAWYALLAEGLSIFHRSISDVQFLLDGLETQALEVLMRGGTDALIGLITDIQERIADERKSQDEQYALDRIALAEEPIEAYIQALDNAEADETALETGVEQWLCGVLRLKKGGEKDPFTLEVTRQTLIPRLPWQKLLEAQSDRLLTWKRRIATHYPAVTLLRPGAPLLDVLTRFTCWDDRGTAFITYRAVPDWSGDVWIGFKLCFTIEPDLAVTDLLDPSPAELAASRRAQCYFAQSDQTLFIDINGAVVTEAALIKILSKPYIRSEQGFGSDLNLGSRQHIFEDFIDPASFPAICRRVRDNARQILLAQPSVQKAIATAMARATYDLQRRQNRSRYRQSEDDTITHEDIALIQAILPAIAAPAIRLDAMGCFILGKRLSHD